MKKKRLILPAAIAALLLALASLLGVMFGGRGTNRAYAAGEYDFEFTYYSLSSSKYGAFSRCIIPATMLLGKSSLSVLNFLITAL